MAVWGYQFINTGTELDQVIEHFHSEIVGPYWPPERKLLNDGYTDIVFPYSRLNAPAFSMSAKWNLEHLIGYLNTWSAVKKYEEINNNNPLISILPELEKYWGEARQEKSVYWPLNIYLGQKP